MVKHTLKILQPLLQHFKRVSDHILDSRHHRKKFKNVILAAINEHILFSGVFMINLDFIYQTENRYIVYLLNQRIFRPLSDIYCRK